MYLTIGGKFKPQKDVVQLQYGKSSFGGLEVVCWPLVPKFAPGQTRQISRAKKSSPRRPLEGK
jgi:hypothetical protein